jgi:addiction module RelB/DinJ family antitoxin
MDTTLQVRIDRKTKAAAQRAFKRAGVSFSGGLRLVLTHIGRVGELPPGLFTFDNLPEAEKRAIVREARNAHKNGKRHSNVQAMLDTAFGE